MMSVPVCVQIKRTEVSSLVSIYKVDVDDEQSPSSSPSPPAAAAAVYNATDVDQVSVSLNDIGLQLPPSISTISGVYSVLLQTGK